jgi:hypothetical protein
MVNDNSGEGREHHDSFVGARSEADRKEHFSALPAPPQP